MVGLVTNKLSEGDFVRISFSAVLVLGLFLAAGSVTAADESCRQLQKEYVGKKFISKEPLYDTVIGHAGIIKLERDKQEIRPGAVCLVKDIECGGKRVEVILKQVSNSKEFNKVEIRFRIHKVERQGPDGMVAANPITVAKKARAGCLSRKIFYSVS